VDPWNPAAAFGPSFRLLANRHFPFPFPRPSPSVRVSDSTRLGLGLRAKAVTSGLARSLAPVDAWWQLVARSSSHRDREETDDGPSTKILFFEPKGGENLAENGGKKKQGQSGGMERPSSDYVLKSFTMWKFICFYFFGQTT
jgi:hypothetical protein